MKPSDGTLENYMDSPPSLTDFYLENAPLFFANDAFRNLLGKTITPDTEKYLFKKGELSEEERFKHRFHSLLEGGEGALRLIAGLGYDKQTPLLEIGGGLGIVYGYLKALGYNIHSIEPIMGGYTLSREIARAVFDILDVSPDHFFNLSTDNLTTIDHKYDIIFSFYTFEHVSNLPLAFKNMGAVLNEKGRMVHIVPNYTIPFETHFEIPLVPLFPKLTEFFIPRLKQDGLWNGLNFITNFKIDKVCQSAGLDVKYDRENLYNALLRLDDPNCEFSQSKSYLIPPYRLMKWCGLLGLLKYFPITLTSPLRFTVRHLPRSYK
ncbi:MAG: methyltransferase domain-containing protein [Magnetococcales bacterium]|nr:methyltransferase domain-containing protein [Magnetococcales bacterium]